MNTTDAPTAQDEKKKKFVKGGAPGPGRPKGSKDSIPRNVREEIAKFFTDLTADNLRWRKNVRDRLSASHDPAELRAWTKLALEYSLGTPSRMPVPVPHREPMRFLSVYLGGKLPWDESVDPMRAKTTAMIEAERAREASRALEAANRVIEAKVETAPTDADELVVVEPSPEPGEFGAGRIRR